MKKYLRFFLLLLSGVILLAELTAQETLPAVDTTEIAEPAVEPFRLEPVTTSEAPKKRFLRTFLRDDYPNPRKAMLLSFFLPGAGQVYNKKYWKAPIAIGGTIGMAYVIRYNTRSFRLFNGELAARESDEDDLIPDPRLSGWSNEDLNRERNRWEKQKELSYLGLIGVQLFTGIDAFVDAHLMGFEIDEDLTMKIKPSFETVSGTSMAFGVGLAFQW